MEKYNTTHTVTHTYTHLLTATQFLSVSSRWTPGHSRNKFLGDSRFRGVCIEFGSRPIFLLYLSISIALLTVFQMRSRLQQLTLSRSLHAEGLQATVSEGLAQGSWHGV